MVIFFTYRYKYWFFPSLMLILKQYLNNPYNISLDPLMTREDRSVSRMNHRCLYFNYFLYYLLEAETSKRIILFEIPFIIFFPHLLFCMEWGSFGLIKHCHYVLTWKLSWFKSFWMKGLFWNRSWLSALPNWFFPIHYKTTLL